MGVVNDVGDDALEVTIALAEVEGVKAGDALAVLGVGMEDRSRALTLCPNHSSHLLLARICHSRRRPWLDEEERS